MLYIGITSRLPRRLKEHQKFTSWWSQIKFIEIENFASRAELLEAEKEAIRVERPKYNVVYNRKFREPEPVSALGQSRDDITRRVLTFKPLYKIKEAAQLLGVSTMVLRRAIEAGEINSVQLPARTAVHDYVSGWQLIDWLESKGARP